MLLRLFYVTLLGLLVLGCKQRQFNLESEVAAIEPEDLKMTLINDLQIDESVQKSKSEWLIRLSGRLLRGSNPCHAQDAKVSFTSSREGEILTLIGKIERSNRSRMCTMEYNPVYEKKTFEVVFNVSQVSRVVVKNVEGPQTLDGEDTVVDKVIFGNQ